MFLTGSFGGLRASFSGLDPDTEREPPPEPTLATFPVHLPYAGEGWSTASLPEFHRLFAKVSKPADVSDEHMRALNISVSPPCSVADLLPSVANGTSYLPSSAQETSADEDPAATRKRKDFDDRIVELSIDNDLAFRTITRNVAQGVRPPRIAHMRKFWEGLENMSQYWDSSLDQYYKTTDSVELEAKFTKRQKLERQSPCDMPRTEPIASERTWPIIEGDSSRHGNESSSTSKPHSPSNQNDQSESESAVGDSHAAIDETNTMPKAPTMRYKGRRTGTGRDMPDQYRAGAVRGFVEGTIWPFRTSVSPPRVMPVIQFGTLVLPVRQTAAVYRVPDERVKARQGWLAGPIIGVQVRPETDFQLAEKEKTVQKSRLDLMREIGGLLQIAQERRRENKAEVKPGEGKWWTTTPRWGGGPGGEVENELGNSDVVALAQELSEDMKEDNDRKDNGLRRDRRRKTPAILWKELKCGKGFWDPRIEYEAIGKETKSEYDEIFMLSSINHHISIVKLTIHDKYTDCLISGTAIPSPPEDQDWCKPQLQRSQWFDLFDIEQRLEAFRGLWQVMAYMTRP